MLFAFNEIIFSDSIFKLIQIPHLELFSFLSISMKLQNPAIKLFFKLPGLKCKCTKKSMHGIFIWSYNFFLFLF